MRTLWCQQHNASQAHPDIPDLCWYRERMTLINPELAPCRMVPMRLIPDNAPFTVPAAEGRNEEPYELGWCVEHHDVARRWPDGSLSCWWESVVESSGDHSPADFQPLWLALDGETP